MSRRAERMEELERQRALAIKELENARNSMTASTLGGRGRIAEAQDRLNSIRERLAALRTADAEPGGWIVGNAKGDRWRTWESGMPDWTDDREKAIRYARREDAEMAHAEDDDAWKVMPFLVSQHGPGAEPGGDVVERARKIAAEVLCRENWKPGVKAGIYEDIMAGNHDSEPLVMAALTALNTTQPTDAEERATEIAIQVCGGRPDRCHG